MEDTQDIPGNELPTKEDGKECIKVRKEEFQKFLTVIDSVTHQLNTRPIIVLPVGTIAGDRLMMAFDEGEKGYCPIALLHPPEVLKTNVLKIHLSQQPVMVPQKDVPGLAEYQEILKAPIRVQT